jgi:hypothetical protein
MVYCKIREVFSRVSLLAIKLLNPLAHDQKENPRKFR